MKSLTNSDNPYSYGFQADSCGFRKPAVIQNIASKAAHDIYSLHTVHLRKSTNESTDLIKSSSNNYLFSGPVSLH